MTPELEPPTRRSCERCGRQDTWDDAAGKWTIVVEEGERKVGDPHCIHEWDITATYNPFGDA